MPTGSFADAALFGAASLVQGRYSKLDFVSPHKDWWHYYCRLMSLCLEVTSIQMRTSKRNVGSYMISDWTHYFIRWSTLNLTRSFLLHIFLKVVIVWLTGASNGAWTVNGWPVTTCLSYLDVDFLSTVAWPLGSLIQVSRHCYRLSRWKRSATVRKKYKPPEDLETDNVKR